MAPVNILVYLIGSGSPLEMTAAKQTTTSRVARSPSLFDLMERELEDLVESESD